METIENDVLEILKQGTVEGTSYRLPQIQLDRKMYEKTNQVLENLGCKWDRKTKSHVCKGDISEKFGKAIESGVSVNEKKLYQFFETPKELAKRMVELAEIKDEMTVLEPSAGHGAIAEAISEFGGPLDIGLVMVEIDPEKCKVLEEKKIASVLCEDFMGTFAEQYGKFDRVLMNPPFTKQQDVKHIIHAYENCLEDGGRLVAITSNSFTFRSEKLSQKFRDLIEKNGWYEQLPEGTFKESGTNVNTCLVVLNK